MWDEFLNILTTIVDVTQAKILVYLLIGNLVSGAVAGVVTGTFKLAKLMEIWKRILGMFTAYVVAAFVAVVLVDFEPLRTVAWATLVAALVAYIVANLQEMGLPLPESLAKYLK